MSFEPKNFQQIFEEMRDRSTVVSDFQVGSVARTLYESFAYELALLYEKMNIVYMGGFVDTATGTQLDNVVAILGIKRGLPDFAEGVVTFIRDSGTDNILIPVGTLVATEETPEQEKKVFQTLEEKTLEGSQTQVDVKVRAVLRGEEEVTPAETIVVMPRPIPGIKEVINNDEIRFVGKGSESDEELRERAKNTLISAGKASQVSLENGLLSLPKVKGVKIREDFSVPEGYGVIDIFIDGPDLNDPDERLRVENTINEFRAAGIFHRLQAASQIQVDGNIVIELNPSLNLSTEETTAYEARVLEQIEVYMDKLAIGESLIFAKLIQVVLSVDGVENLTAINLATEDEGGIVVNYTFASMRIDVGEFQRLLARNITVTS